MDRKRSAILRVESDNLSVEQISEIVGDVPDRYLRKGEIGRNPHRPLKDTTWELREDVPGEEYLELALERLWPRILPLESGMKELSRKGCFLRLAIVQRISAADPHGPGFGLKVEELRFLADIGAILDIDQYAD
ncbi:DUF4279 domain-containing protein [Streptomyces sp. NPDC001549]|uniref:DUF4279 domain-containing protein n=1 Tax=Streptomyces sp. NPDC001549 TaxID=3364586 RepID=UPI0036B70864